MLTSMRPRRPGAGAFREFSELPVSSSGQAPGSSSIGNMLRPAVCGPFTTPPKLRTG